MYKLYKQNRKRKLSVKFYNKKNKIIIRKKAKYYYKANWSRHVCYTRISHALRHLRLTFFSKIWRHSWSPSNNFHATTSLSYLLKPEIYYNVRPIVNPFFHPFLLIHTTYHYHFRSLTPTSYASPSHATVILCAKYDLSKIHKAVSLSWWWCHRVHIWHIMIMI